MSRQVGSLNRSLSYPSNLQSHSQVLPFFDFPPYPEPLCTNKSPSMDSDNNSTNTNFHTTSQFNTFDIETPDEFADSEPRPSTFSNSPFNPSIPKSPMNLPQLLPPTLMQPQSTPPMTSDTNHSSPVDTELENELDNFINLQQLLQHPNTLTIHHLSQIMTSSESSNSPSTNYWKNPSPPSN